MKNTILLIALIAAIPACSKKSINDIENFDPQFHIGDYEKAAIKNRAGVEVSCNEKKFNEFACMHTDKVKELNVILSRYRRRTPVAAREVSTLINELEKNHVR